MVHDGTWHRRGALRLRRLVASVVAALVASLVAVAMVAPGNAHAFAWKDVCQITVVNETGSVNGLKIFGPILVEVPPNPVDEANWDLVNAVGHFIGIGSIQLSTLGIPLTWGCQIHPTFNWGTALFATPFICDVVAPSSGRNTFRCSQDSLDVRITTNNADIKGIVRAGTPPGGLAAGQRTSGSGASSAAVPRMPKRVRALLGRGDLPGRGWRLADQVTDFGRLGEIFATSDLPASCQDDKADEPQAKRGGASAFARRSAIIGSEHGVYANPRQSRQRLGAAVSTHSISCLARLLTSAELQSHAKFARYELPGLTGVKLWRVLVRTRLGNGKTGTNYVDVAGLLHRSSNALVLFANAKKPVPRKIEQSEIRTVASRLP